MEWRTFLYLCSKICTMTCRFCDIAQRKVEDYVIWEDDKFIAFLDITPAKPSHCMLIPKLHVDYFFDLPESLYLNYSRLQNVFPDH